MTKQSLHLTPQELVEMAMKKRKQLYLREVTKFREVMPGDES